MIKCNVNKEKMRHTWVKVDGTPKQLMTELCFLICQIYRAIKRHYPEAAQEFKNNLLFMLLDPRSPVWKEEDHAES